MCARVQRMALSPVVNLDRAGAVETPDPSEKARSESDAEMVMTEKTVDLDRHRGMAAQKATDLRRLVAEVEANEQALRLRQDELESQLIAAPAANWHEAAEKARYLVGLFAASLAAQDPRRRKLIAAVLDDFSRLSSEADDTLQPGGRQPAAGLSSTSGEGTP